MDTIVTNDDGFIEPSSKKRSHPTSPKKDGIPTCNSFLALEEGHSTKKQALLDSTTDGHETPSGSGSKQSSLVSKRNDSKSTTALSSKEQRVKLSRERNASQQPLQKSKSGKIPS